MATTYLYRTISSGGADLTKWTWSCWVKRTDLVGAGNGCQRIISNEVSGNNKSWYIRFQPNGEFHAWSNNGAFEFTTNAKYRDVNGWYHFVIKYDSTQSTEADRLKIYVNGEQPSMANIHYPTLNETVNFMNTGNYIDIGYYRQTPGEYFFGLMSHMHFTAGYAYDASSFGSTDSTTGEWKINTSPSVTYGSLGFFILKDGNTITDSSPNSNNFSLGGGTLTKTEDNPSNVFATLNPLSSGTDFAFSNGNNTIINSTSTWNSVLGTLAFGTGKYYFEAQRISANGTANIGITLSSKFGGNHSGVDSGRIMYSSNGNVYKDAWSGLSNNTSGGTIGSGDIIGVSIDTENGILKFYRNAELRDTTTNSLLLSSNNEFIPALACYQGGHWRVNFGNGHFADNVVSSAGTNASGNGIFEYDIQPTDATALSTKGLNL